MWHAQQTEPVRMQKICAREKHWVNVIYAMEFFQVFNGKIAMYTQGSTHFASLQNNNQVNKRTTTAIHKRKQWKNYMKTRWNERMHKNCLYLSLNCSFSFLGKCLILRAFRTPSLSMSTKWWAKYPLYLIEYIQNFSCHLITSMTKSIYHNDKFSFRC